MIEVLHEYFPLSDEHEIVITDVDDTDIVRLVFTERDCIAASSDWTAPHEAHDDILQVMQLLQSIYDPAYKGPLMVFLAKE